VRVLEPRAVSKAETSKETDMIRLYALKTAPTSGAPIYIYIKQQFRKEIRRTWLLMALLIVSPLSIIMGGNLQTISQRNDPRRFSITVVRSSLAFLSSGDLAGTSIPNFDTGAG